MKAHMKGLNRPKFDKLQGRAYSTMRKMVFAPSYLPKE